MNILITYDFLTTNSKLGKSLVNKFSFLKEVIATLDVNIELDDNLPTFNKELFLNTLNHNTKDNTYTVTNMTNIKKDSIEMILNHINQYDLIIVYELSNESKRVFENLGLKYIDIWMSPIRFYKDIMFSFTSNCPSIYSKFMKYKIEDKLLFDEADKLSKYCSFIKKDNIKLEDNSLLVVGQLFKDKAIMKDGIFLNLINYKKEIQNLSKRYTKLYFLKHPLMSEGEFKIILEEFENIENFEYLKNVNIYSLLSKVEVKKVISLSSSVLYEAKYFNKDIEYLFKPVIDDSYINIFKEFYKNSFWADILEIKSKTKIEYIVSDNYLRYKMNALYAYKYFLEDDINKRVYNSIIEIYNILNSLRGEYILYGYGSVGKLIAPFLRNKIRAIIDKDLSNQEILNKDGFNVIKINDLKQNDTVLISAFLYNDEIIKHLKQTSCKIIKIEV